MKSNIAIGTLLRYFSSKPTSSEVLTSYLTQCKEPPWTSYFVKVKEYKLRNYICIYFWNI